MVNISVTFLVSFLATAIVFLAFVLPSAKKIYAEGLIGNVCKTEFIKKLDSIESKACSLTGTYPDVDIDTLNLGNCVEYMYVESYKRHIKFAEEDEREPTPTICKEPFSGTVEYVGFDWGVVHEENAKTYTVFISPGQISLSGCMGTATPCDSLNEEKCGFQNGCTWSGTIGCRGPATACSAIFEQSKCGTTKDEPQYGCSWTVPTPPVTLPPPEIPCPPSTGAPVYLSSGRFIGVNMYGLPSVPSDTVESTLSYLSNNCGVTVVRIFGFGSVAPENIKKVLDIGSGHGIRFIIALEDFHGPVVNNPIQWYSDGYKSSYKPYVQLIVSTFKDRQEILMWELLNEPHCKDQGEPCKEAFYNFIVDMSKTIKSIDPNHIVSIGVAGGTEQGQSVDDGSYQRIHSINEIGAASGHYYYTPSGSNNRICRNLEAAKSINKPFYIGEYGNTGRAGGCESGGCINICSSNELNSRADQVESEMRDMFNRGASGFLIWQYSIEHRPECDDFSFFVNDPLCARMKAISDSIR